MTTVGGFDLFFNQDGFGALAALADTEMTEADCVRLLVEPLVSAGIRAIDWCILTTGQHNCRTRHGREFRGDGQGRAIDRLVGRVVMHYNAQPRDLLDIVVRSGHEAGLQVFGNIRLNHGALNPERLLSCPGRNAGQKKDFRDPALHQYLCELAEDILAKGVDGISLDFERKAPFFPDDAPASERFDACTDFLRRVRELTAKPVVVRVSHEPCKGEPQGQNPERWIAEGLVDIVVPATHNHEPDRFDWRPQRSLDAAAQSPRPCRVCPQVWPTPEQWSNGENVRHSAPAVRARLQDLRQMGAAGAYFFNFLSEEMQPITRGLAFT